MTVVMHLRVGRDNKYVVDMAIPDGGYDKYVLVEITSTWWICRIHDGGYNKYVLEKLTSMWWMWRIHEGGYDKYVLVEITSMWWI